MFLTLLLTILEIWWIGMLSIIYVILLPIIWLDNAVQFMRGFTYGVTHPRKKNQTEIPNNVGRYGGPGQPLKHQPPTNDSENGAA